MRVYDLFVCTTETRAIDLFVEKSQMTVAASLFILPGVGKQQPQSIRWRSYFPTGRIPGGISFPKGR